MSTYNPDTLYQIENDKYLMEKVGSKGMIVKPEVLLKELFGSEIDKIYNSEKSGKVSPWSNVKDYAENALNEAWLYEGFLLPLFRWLSVENSAPPYDELDDNFNTYSTKFALVGNKYTNDPINIERVDPIFNTSNYGLSSFTTTPWDGRVKIGKITYNWTNYNATKMNIKVTKHDMTTGKSEANYYNRIFFTANNKTLFQLDIDKIDPRMAIQNIGKEVKIIFNFYNIRSIVYSYLFRQQCNMPAVGWSEGVPSRSGDLVYDASLNYGDYQYGSNKVGIKDFDTRLHQVGYYAYQDMCKRFGTDKFARSTSMWLKTGLYTPPEMVNGASCRNYKSNYDGDPYNEQSYQVTSQTDRNYTLADITKVDIIIIAK